MKKKVVIAILIVTVTNGQQQDVYVSTEQTIQKVFVTEGQEVSEGDPLLQYDMTNIDLAIEMKKLDIQTIENNSAVAQKELEKLKNTKPISNATTSTPSVDSVTPSAPETPSTDTSVTTPDTVEEKDTPVEPVVPDTPSVPDDNQQSGYTADELAKEIADKEKELTKLDLDKRKAELALKQMESQSEDGMVYAEFNGTVKKAGDPDNLPNDGSAFLTLSGSDGLYVKGTLNELALEQVKVGQSVTATSWSTGMVLMQQ